MVPFKEPLKLVLKLNCCLKCCAWFLIGINLVSCHQEKSDHVKVKMQNDNYNLTMN